MKLAVNACSFEKTKEPMQLLSIADVAIVSQARTVIREVISGEDQVR